MLSRRRDVVSAIDGAEFVGDVGPAPTAASLRDVDVLFVGASSGERYEVAGEALRCGVHLFLEWPPATSMQECAELIRLAEEAGLECGVSRPLRFSRLFGGIDDESRADVISLTLHGDPYPTEVGRIGYRSTQLLMADAVDLSCYLAGSSSVQRVDAAAVHQDTARRDAALFSLRFHSGAYAQVFIRLNGSAAPATIYASGQGICVEGTLEAPEDALKRETAAFLTAIFEGQPSPVSAFDALQTMRIVERLQAVLR